MTVRISTWESADVRDSRPYRATVRYADRADHRRFATEAERADFLARIAEHHDTDCPADQKESAS